MHALELFPTQIMSQYKQNMKELVKSNKRVTKNKFLLPTDVHNICKKIAKELWKKHHLYPIRVHKNLDFVFSFIENTLF